MRASKKTPACRMLPRPSRLGAAALLVLLLAVLAAALDESRLPALASMLPPRSSPHRKLAHRILQPPSGASLLDLGFSGVPECAALGFTSQPAGDGPRGGSKCGCDATAPGWAYTWSSGDDSVAKVGCAKQHREGPGTLNGCEQRIADQISPNNFQSFFGLAGHQYLCYQARETDLYQRPRRDGYRDFEQCNALEVLTQDLLYCTGAWRGRDGCPTEVGAAHCHSPVISEWFDVSVAYANCVMNRVMKVLDNRDTIPMANYKSETVDWCSNYFSTMTPEPTAF